MLLVAFDTVFEQCSLAVMQGEKVIYHDTILGGRGQTEIILPMLDKAFSTLGIGMADVQAWAFNQGPGAFSGIRINTAVVQALSVANDAPCVGVSSLLALAFVAVSEGGAECMAGKRVAAVMDARQNQLYVGEFELMEFDKTATDETADAKTMPYPVLQAASDERLLDYGSALVADFVAGDGAGLLKHDACVIDVKPTAVHIAKLACQNLAKGLSVPPQDALPVYLRHNAWKTLAEQKQARQDKADKSN